MGFLSNEAIENLKNGKSDGRYYFKVINDSICENLFLERFWHWVTYNILPDWLAPNLMTFIGFILNQFGFACLVYHYPTPPSWALFTCALCFWLYQTLDGSDGKQARKTDNCSQLGEIFDHGVDALSVTAFTMTTTLLGGKDPSNFPSMIWLWIIIFASFIICHWEHYHTGVFYLGYTGPCDAQMMIIITLLVSAIVNDLSIWKVPLSQVFGYDHFLLQYSYGDLFMFVTCAGGLLTIAQSTYQVFKKTNILKSLRDLIPTFIFLSLFYIYARTSKMWTEHYILVSYFITPIFGTVSSTMNIARVTLLPVPLFPIQYIMTTGILFLCTLNANFEYLFQVKGFDDYYFSVALFSISTLYYIYFAVKIAREIADALGIRIFHIKNKK